MGVERQQGEFYQPSLFEGIEENLRPDQDGEARSLSVRHEEPQAFAASDPARALSVSLEKFFDRVNHDILMSRLARRVGDKRLWRIIRRFLEAGMLQNGVCVERHEGTPQGGPLSPLLANLLLDDLDRELERRGHRFCRYADDCNI